MALATYTDLQAAVKDWAARFDSSVVTRVPDFIRLGEERIWQTGEKVVRSQWGIKHDTLIVPGGQNWVALPSDWLAFERVRTSDQPRVEYMPADQLEDLPSPGQADAYSIEGGRFLYGQTPQSSLTLTVKYYQHPGLLSAAGNTWLLAKAPSIYLYSALLECAIYVKNSDKVAEFGALLNKAVNGFDSVEQGDLLRGGRLRVQGRF